jgi:predicted GH43/DUF377 family glycosyl hydrolase
MNFLLFLLLSITPIWHFVDLEEDCQDFVLETRKIEIPGYPHGFNPSIIRFRGHNLMIFRTGAYQDAESSTFLLQMLPSSRARRTDEMALVFLDNDFRPISEPTIVNIQHHHGLRAFHQQDPRLVEVGGHLYIVYSNMLENSETPLRRVFVTEVFYDGLSFSYGEPEYLCHFDNPHRVEKNWPPSLVPHNIVRPLLGSGVVPSVACTESHLLWDYGELRGGTPALLENGEYLAIFHSSKKLASRQSEGKKMVHYFMGAYTFAAKPPFELKKISPRPIVGKNFYNGPAHNTWKPLRVVFPAGIIIDEKYIWVSYGRQDHEMWVVKCDKKGLLRSLIPIN